MILAYKSGVLQAVTVVRESQKSTLVKFCGEPNKKPVRVLKHSPTQKLFTDVDLACEWIGVEVSK